MSSFLLPDRVIKSLTNNDIKALPSTGITIVAAPGAGYRIKVLSATLTSDFSAAAYTNVNTTYAALTIEASGGQWLAAPIANDSTSTPALTSLTTFMGAADYMVDLLPGYEKVYPLAAAAGWTIPWVGYTPTHFDNVLVRVKMDNNGSGALTGGNAANTLKITMTYLVEPT
jgi:hypothetical protein